MRHYLFLLILLSIHGSAFAQHVDYSYISDRKFKDPTDLVGYDFKPSIVEYKDGGKSEISPGEYSFGITQNNLFVEGEEIKGVYSINNINSTDYGYTLLLMNARNPTIQGHLKIILNDDSQVDAMIFKRSTNEDEMIFYQAQMPESRYMDERAYFTDRFDLEIEHRDSVWADTIVPFMKIHSRQQGVQQRLYISDSTSVEFIQTIRIVDKSKKKKRKKEEEVLPLPTISEALKMTDEERKKRKIKVLERYVVKIRSILTYDDGTEEDIVKEYDVKKVVEREDETAAPGDERFQIEFVMERGAPMFLYLTPKRTVSSFETEDHLYLMRGF